MRPYEPHVVREKINELASKGQDASLITKGHMGVITAKLISICGSNPERYKLLYCLFPSRWASLASVTSKSLKTWDWYALSKWTDVHKDEETSRWVYHKALEAEIKAILEEGGAEKSSPEVPPDQHRKTTEQINKELGYEPTPTEIYDPSKSMPIMECGHEADQFSPTGRPFCGRHPDRPKSAYQKKMV